MYPSPATRFGARDGGNEETLRFSSSHFAVACSDGGGVTGRNGGADLSLHFTSNRNDNETMELSPHGGNRDQGWDAANQTESSGNCSSPHLDAYGKNNLRRRSPEEYRVCVDGFGYYGDDQDIRRPRRLALDNASSSSRKEQHAHDSAAQMRWDHSIPGCVSVETHGRPGSRDDFANVDYYNKMNLSNRGGYGSAPLSTLSRNDRSRDQNQDSDQGRWAATGVDVVAAGLLHDAAGGGEEANSPVCDENLGGNPLDKYEETPQLDYLGGGKRVGFVAEAPVLGCEEWSPPPPLPGGGFGHGSILARPHVIRPNGCRDRHARGRGRRGERERKPLSTIARGSSPARGEWLRRVPGLETDGEAVHEIRNPLSTSAAAVAAPAPPAAVKGVNERSLSRLFEYAFADPDQSRGSQGLMNGGNKSRSRRDHTYGSGGDDGRSSGNRAAEKKGPARKWAGRRRVSNTDGDFNRRVSRSRPPYVPLLLTEEGPGLWFDEKSAPSRRPVAGATVRRPPSPKFDFFAAETEASAPTLSSISSRIHDGDGRREMHSPPALRQKQEENRGGDEALVATDEVQGKSRSPAHEPRGSSSNSSSPIASERLLLGRKRDGFSRFAPPLSGADIVSEMSGESRQVDDGHPPVLATVTQATASHESYRTGKANDASRLASTSPRALFARKRARPTSDACIDDAPASAGSSSSYSPPSCPPPNRRQRRHSPLVLERSTRASTNEDEKATARLPSRGGRGMPEDGIQASTPRTEEQEEAKEEEEEEDQEDQERVILGNGWLGKRANSPRRCRQGRWNGQGLTGSGRGSPRDLAGGAVNEASSSGGGNDDHVRGTTSAIDEGVEPSAEASVASEETSGEPRVHGGWERHRNSEREGDSERVTGSEDDGQSEGGNRLPSGDKQLAPAMQVDVGESHTSSPEEVQGAHRMQSFKSKEQGGTHSEDVRRQLQQRETGALPEAENTATVDVPSFETSFDATAQAPGRSSSTGGRSSDESAKSDRGRGVDGEGGLVRRAMNNLRHTADVALAYDLDVLGGDGLGSHGVAATAAAELDDEEELSAVVGGAILESFLPTEACDRCAM